MPPLDGKQYQQLVENSPAMIWRCSSDGLCTYVNPTWVAFTGRSLEEEAGDGFTSSVHSDDVRDFRATHAEHLKNQTPFTRTYRLRRFDGAYFRVVDHGAPYADDSGAFAGFIGNCVMSADLPSVESFGVDEFFEMSLDNVCVAGLDGYFKRLNPSWTKTLGWSLEELMARPSVEFVHPDDREMTLAGRDRLRSGAALGPLTNRYICKDGSFRWFEWRSVAHTARGLVYAVARDVTEQKLVEQGLASAKELQEKLQRQLIFADRMASVGTLAAGVAHEINNPLAFVTTNLSLALSELRTLDVSAPSTLLELKEMLTDAQMGAERIRKIVRGLKTFSRAEEEQRVITDVVPLLELSINMTFNEIRHRARLVKDFGKIPRVAADEARLGQVFINLLINAAQALPEGDTAAHEIRLVTSTDTQGRAVIEVSDTGSGIPAEVVERIFDPFFTTKAVGVGTGLGLSICHTIVTAMGGEMVVESKLGAGTTFRVVLPAATTTTEEETAVPPSAPKKDLACASVLVVDDEPALGLIFRRVLSDHEVTAVTTAKQALELLDTGKQFDIIFSDLMMPEMSGMEFYAELTRRFSHLTARVVFVSGGAFTPQAQAFLDGVENQRLEKPFDPDDVSDLVGRMLASGR